MGDALFGRKSFSDLGRQHPRFRTRPLHRVSLQPHGNNPLLRIANVSLGGIGVFSDGLTEPLQQSFAAVLSIGEEKFEIFLEKRFANEELTGFQFQVLSDELRAAIEKYFETELLASKLSRVETKGAKTTDQEKVIFFHGKNNCELLINERKSQICYFNIVVLGNSIEVTPKINITARELITDESIPKRPGVTLFKPYQINSHLIETASRFIDNIDALPPDYRKNLIDLLTELHPDQKRKSEK